MKFKFGWDNFNNPIGMSIDALLYRIRVNDPDGQVFDSVSMGEVLLDADELMPVFDALYAPHARLERKLNQLKIVMDRASSELQVDEVKISEPFKQNGSVQVAAIFTLSDGQTITIYFHNPDSTPDKLLPNDVLVSWKWLLNKKDITIVVAPENGRDVNVREVGVRIMRLAAKNSAIFVKKNEKKEADKQLVSSLETEVLGLERKLTDLNAEIDLAKQSKDEAELKFAEDNVGEHDGYVTKAMARIASIFKRNNYDVTRKDSSTMSIITPLSKSVVFIKVDDNGRHIIESNDSVEFSKTKDNMDLHDLVRFFDKTDFLLSTTEDESQIEFVNPVVDVPVVDVPVVDVPVVDVPVVDDPVKSVVLPTRKPKINNDESLDFVKSLIANPENYVSRENLQKLKDIREQYAGSDNAALVSQALKALQTAVFSKLSAKVSEG